MDILIFLFNIILLVIFVAAGVLSFANYKKQPRMLYQVIGLLFLVYICDNTIIYMTEFIAWFSQRYNNQFMTLPAFKTISILAQSACTLYISNILLKKKMQMPHYMILLTMGFLLMFIPMMADSAYKVWLYYLPSQVYQFWLGIYGLNTLKANPADYEQPWYDLTAKLFRLTALFAVLILIEDTIVIFNFDIYSQLLVRINNRNVCEDILSLLYSYFTITTMFRLLVQTEQKTEQVTVLNGLPEGISDVVAAAATSATSVADTAVQRAETGSLPVPPVSVIRDIDEEAEQIDSFCEHYDLTAREQEIFAYLIRDMSNQEICDELCISIGTVKAHIHNIFVKLDVVKRSQVLRTFKNYVREKQGKSVS